MSGQPETRAVRPYVGVYPKGAVEHAIEALELAYSYLRDEQPVAAAKIEEALRLLNRAREINA